MNITVTAIQPRAMDKVPDNHIKNEVKVLRGSAGKEVLCVTTSGKGAGTTREYAEITLYWEQDKIFIPFLAYKIEVLECIRGALDTRVFSINGNLYVYVQYDNGEGNINKRVEKIVPLGIVMYNP